MGPLRLRSQLLLALTPLVIGVLGLLAFGSYRAARTAILGHADRELSARTRARTEELAHRFERAQLAAQELADTLAAEPSLRSELLSERLRQALLRAPDLLGMAVALVPRATPMDRWALYVHREGAVLDLRSLAGPDYDYPIWPWFQEPLKVGGPVWGDPYLGGAVRRLMVTCSVPFGRKGQWLGVVTADLSLDRLGEFLTAITEREGGSAYLAARGGRFVKAGQDASGASPQGRLDLEALLKEPGASHGELVDPVSGLASWVVEQPLGQGPAGWSLVASRPTRGLLEPLHRFRVWMLWGSGVALLIVVVAVLGLTQGIGRRLEKLVVQAQRYGAGDFGAPLTEHQGPTELRTLAQVFNGMGRDIVAQMEEVRVTTAQRERYHQELVIAAEFQQDVLPTVFPPFPELAPALDLYGVMAPAKEVGGDYFDCFRLPNGRLALVVGDVSDKGAPAALFMTQTRLLIRLLAAQGLGPGEVLRRANRVLVREMPGRMFVTLVYVDYDPACGAYVLASAGHPNPILLPPAASPAEVMHPRALPLGAFNGTRYAEVRGVLPPDAGLLLYSDGLSEAMNPQDEEFGLARIFESLGSESGSSCRERAEWLCQRVAKFADGAAPSDDLTLLMLRRLDGFVVTPDRADHAVRLVLPPAPEGRALGLRAITAAFANDPDLAPLVAVFLSAVEVAGCGETPLTVDLCFEPEVAQIRVTDQGEPKAYGDLLKTAEGLDHCVYLPNQEDGNCLVLELRRQKL